MCLQDTSRVLREGKNVKRRNKKINIRADEDREKFKLKKLATTCGKLIKLS